MSEPKLITPLLADHLMGDPISNHHGVQCCPALHKETQGKYIVKILSIPATSVQLDALLLSGAFSNKESALEYFKELSDGIVQEAEVLRKLSSIEGFCGYEGWQIVPKDDADGYDVYLLGPYRPTLERFYRSKPMTHLAALNLGLDLCAALSVCRRNGYLYVALKPENVFLTGEREYRIGDLGFIHLDSLKYASLPERYRSAYTAPEITDAYASLNSTLDVFATGLILYQAYNNGQLPDLSQFPAQPLDPPQYADYEMAQIILKACAIDPADRWEDPALMGQELVNYMQRNSVNDVPIVPPAEPVQPENEDCANPEALADESISEENEVCEEVAEESILAENETSEEAVADQDSNADLGEQTQEQSDTTDAADAVPQESDAESADVVSGPDAEDEAAELEDIHVDPLSHEADAEKDEEESIQVLLSDPQADDTAPSEETLSELTDATVTDEVSAMLAHADELISHKTPDPVIQPEPIEIPIPAPIVAEPEEDAEATVSDPDLQAGDAENPQLQQQALPKAAEDEVSNPKLEEVDDVSDEETPASNHPHEPAQKKRHRGLVAAVIAALIVILLAVGAIFYYQNYYLKVISGISVSGDATLLQVSLDTEVDNSLLRVHCTDIYGNKQTSTVTNNTATFTGLNSGTNYKISVDISGFHQLIGTTSTSYTTDAQITVVDFSAITADQDGSVILTFSVQEQENTAWRVYYSAPGEEEKVADCSGHTASITGLAVGKVYTFRLAPTSDLLVAGNHTLEFTASKVIRAQNLQNHGYSNGALRITWEAPEGAKVASWTVRCYNGINYDTTVTVSEPAVSLEGLDPAQSYTVDVKAEGMTVGEWITVSANSITFTDILLDDSNPGQLIVTWNYDGVTPADGWNLFYTVNGGGKYVVPCTTNSCTISPLLPGAVYDISFDLPADYTVFGGTAQYTAPDGGGFDDYGVTWEDFSLRMCWTPANPGWRWFDLFETDFTTTFAIEDKASLILTMDERYDDSDDEINTLFVIRDAQGNIVSINQGRTRQWDSMWSRYNGMNGTELDIPSMPQTPGEYTVDIYFNNALVTTQTFSIH